MNSNHRSLNSLMRHIRACGIAVGGSGDKTALARMGYFHGYKGYRFSRQPGRRVPYSSFAEVKAVAEFDTALKALFYPVLMKLEMSMKNLALVEILDAADSSALSDVCSRLMPGTKKNGMRGKLEVVHASNGVLLSSYKHEDRIVRHYYDGPSGTVPIWALMEVITLGHFATFLEQLSDSVLNDIAASWGLKRKHGDLAPHFVLAVKDLRNCVAHNGMVFDTRFANAKVRRPISDALRVEVGYSATTKLAFDTITDYVVLLAYLACAIGFPKREIAALIRDYQAATEALFAKVPFSIFSVIVHADNRSKVAHLAKWLRTR